MTQAIIFVIFPLCLAVAAFSDLFTMTIPNRVSVVLLAAFIVVAPLAGLGLADIANHFAAGLIVFTVCFALFALNIMGGGDAKLLTASAVWFGLTFSLVEYLVYVSFFGGVLTLAILSLRSHTNLILASGLPVPGHLLSGKKVPYGIAIGIAAFAAYPSSPLMLAALGSAG
jgi:prepilin peptidase CpaA